MGSGAQVTALLTYVERDPGSEPEVTALLAYVERDPGPAARVTALLAYVEIGIGQGAPARPEVTAILAYVERDPHEAAEVTALLAYVEAGIGEGPEPGLPPAAPTWSPVPLPEVFDEEGFRLGFLTNINIRRAFVASDAGSGEGELEPQSLPVRLRWIDVNHLVLVRSRFGLPDWPGVITEVEYQRYKVIFRCKEATYLLARWNGLGYPIKRYPAGLQESWTETGTPAELMGSALSRIIARGEKIIRIGQIDLPGYQPLSIEHSQRRSVLDEFIELKEALGFDFWVNPVVTAGGYLCLYFNAARKKGADKRYLVHLWEGSGIGTATSYRVYSTDYQLQDEAELLSLVVSDTTKWQYLELGDIIRVTAASLGPAGIEKDVRIIGMEPDEERGELELVVEVI